MYKLRYIEKKESPSNSSLLMGISFHTAIEFLVKKRGNVEIKEVKDVFSEVLNSEWIIASVETGIEDESDVTSDKLIEEGKRLLEIYYPKIKRILQTRESINSEKFVKFQVGYVELVGRFDLETEKELIDIKVGKRKKGRIKGSDAIQLDIYRLATNQKKEYLIHNIVRKKQPEIEELSYLPRDEIVITDIVYSVADGIRRGHFPPNGVITDVCSYCSYRRVCKYANV
jgi:CRISPR/Cas system-associated exonuclease Cas4 (RecB family)